MVGCCIMSWLVVVAGLGRFLAAQNKNLLKNVLCCLQVQSIICFCLSNIYFTCRGQTMSHHFPDPDPILTQVYGTISWYGITRPQQATGLDAWASRVKCPARFVSHLHEICIYIWQGWGQVLSEVLESSTSTFKICKLKYKYSQYLDGIKYIKYFFSQVQVQVPSTLVTNNSTVSPKLIYNHYPGTYSYI